MAFASSPPTCTPIRPTRSGEDRAGARRPRERPTTKPETREKVEEIKQQLLDNKSVSLWLDTLWQKGREAIIRAARNPDAAMAGKLGEVLKVHGPESGERSSPEVGDQPVRPPGGFGMAASYGGSIVSWLARRSGAGMRKPHRPVGSDGRPRPSIYPHQRYAGRRPGRPGPARARRDLRGCIHRCPDRLRFLAFKLVEGPAENCSLSRRAVAVARPGRPGASSIRIRPPSSMRNALIAEAGKPRMTRPERQHPRSQKPPKPKVKPKPKVRDAKPSNAERIAEVDPGLRA